MLFVGSVFVGTEILFACRVGLFGTGVGEGGVGGVVVGEGAGGTGTGVGEGVGGVVVREGVGGTVTGVGEGCLSVLYYLFVLGCLVLVRILGKCFLLLTFLLHTYFTNPRSVFLLLFQSSLSKICMWE